MKVVIAVDSFKGSLSSLAAGQAAAEGVRRVFPAAEIAVRPLADGGEGTVEALTLGMNGKLVTARVTGPLGQPVEAVYGIVDAVGSLGGKTAVIEMAAAAGITLVTAAERDPLKTTSYGVGELIRNAISQGCRRFIVGLGGSATNDGGIGMLQALGYGILDGAGRQVPLGAQGLAWIEQITEDAVIPELKDCTFRVACDVTNPLCGPQGCSAVFGPQKGATAATIPQMDGWLGRFADLVRGKYPAADKDRPGTGAAGGLGFAFLSLLDATLESGIKIVLEETNLGSYLKTADIVITGEGRLDAQTAMGKAPIGVAQLAKKYGKPVVAFSGCATQDAAVCNAHGIDAFFPIVRGAATLAEAMDADNASANMAATAEQVFRLVRCCGTAPCGRS